MKIGLLHSRIRTEEKLLIKEFQDLGVEIDVIDLRQTHYDTTTLANGFDALLERCISHNQAVNVLALYESLGVPCVNSYSVAMTCGDKLLTTLALREHNVPSPRTAVAFTSEQAIEAIEAVGYPVVIKPATGSWGRLLAKINDRDAAEAIIEHKSMLGSYHHKTIYIQQYVDKPGRDIRTFVVGDETVAAIYRESEHWITNTARGGKTKGVEITSELNALSVAAANACGGGVLAVDLLETPDGELLVNEVNYTLEFRNSIAPTGVNIPRKIAEYVVGIAERGDRQ